MLRAVSIHEAAVLRGDPAGPPLQAKYKTEGGCDTHKRHGCAPTRCANSDTFQKLIPHANANLTASRTRRSRPPKEAPWPRIDKNLLESVIAHGFGLCPWDHKSVRREIMARRRIWRSFRGNHSL